MQLSAAKLAGSNPSHGRMENDYYATPFHATQAIIDNLPNLFNDKTILEPSAGEGHIVKVLQDNFPNTKIIANDISDRDSRLGIEIHKGIDFLTYNPTSIIDTVITNPPFSLAQQFIEKALTIAKHYVIIFAKIQLLEGESRYENIFSKTPSKYIYVFTKRVNPLRNGEKLNPKGKKWASTMCFAWFIFEIGYKGEPIVRWL